MWSTFDRKPPVDIPPPSLRSMLQKSIQCQFCLSFRSTKIAQGIYIVWLFNDLYPYKPRITCQAKDQLLAMITQYCHLYKQIDPMTPFERKKIFFFFGKYAYFWFQYWIAAIFQNPHDEHLKAKAQHTVWDTDFLQGNSSDTAELLM